MSITIQTANAIAERDAAEDYAAQVAVGDRYRALGLQLHVHNGFASFLDDVLEQLAAGEFPARLFSQGTSAHPDNPGPLNPERSQRLADCLDAASDSDLDAAMIRAYPASLGGNDAAIAFVREISALARAAGSAHGGLAVS